MMELLVTFWEDYYENHKLEARKGKDGEVVFDTGDPYIDKWEKELSMGLTPDLLEDLPSWHRDKEKREEERREKLRQKEFEGDDFDDDSDGFNDNYKNPSFTLPPSARVLGQGK